MKGPLSRGLLEDTDSFTYDSVFIVGHCVRVLLGNVPGFRGVRLLFELRKYITVNVIPHPWSCANRIWWFGSIGRIHYPSPVNLPPFEHLAAKQHEPYDSASLLIPKVRVKKLVSCSSEHYNIGMFFGGKATFRTAEALQHRSRNKKRKKEEE